MAITSQLLRIARDVEPSATDGDLLRRYVQNQDEAAFAEVVRHNGPLVLRACRSVLSEATAAEDAFQATFLVLARRASQLTQPGSLAGWLHAAAIRIARDARRAEVRARRREYAWVPTTPASPDDLTWRELRTILDTELAALPEKYRVPLVLCYLQELSYEEAARRAGCSVGALRGRLERGKERLRKRLAKYGLPLAAPALILGPPTPVSAAITEATLATVRTMVAGGRVPAAVAELIRSQTSLGTALLAPITVALVAVGVVLAGVGRPPTDQPVADPPTPPVSKDASEPMPGIDRFGDPLPDGAVMRLGTTRGRAIIDGFGVTSDGTVVTVTSTAVVRIWPLKGEQPSESVQLPVPMSNGFIPQAVISPDGQFIAANHPEKKVVIWEKKGNEFKEITSFDIKYSRNMRFSPDGTQLVAIGAGIHLCDLRTGKIQQLDRIEGYWDSIAFSGDGTKLAAVKDYEAYLWDLKSGQKLAQYKTGQLRYMGVALDRTGSVLAVSPTWEPYTVVFVEPTTGARIARFTSPEKIRSLWAEFAPDGKTVLIGDRTGITWWDPVAEKLIRRFEGTALSWSGGWTVPAHFTPDGKVLVGTSGRMLLRWDATTGKPLLPHLHDAVHHSDVSAIGITPDGKWIATGGRDARVHVWDVGTGRSVAAFNARNMLGLRNVELSSDGRFVFAPSPDGEGITKWEVATGRAALQFGYSQGVPPRGSLVGYQLSPDGRTLTGLSGPMTTRDPILLSRWDAATGKIMSEKPSDLHLQFPHSEFSPDGRWLATQAALYPTEVGEAGNTLPKDVFSMFNAGTFSLDGRLLVKVLDSRIAAYPYDVWRAAVFEVVTGAKLAEFPLDTLGKLAFHPDGRSIAASESKSLTFHDLTTGKPFAVRKAPEPNAQNEPYAEAIRYFPDGTKLITGHADTTALIWESPARPKRVSNLDEKGLAAAWNDLTSLDGAKGWAAVWALADDPGAVAMLRGKVKPVVAIPAKEFDQLLADLGSDVFATREAATERLGKTGENVVGQLLAALKTELTPEQKVRAERLLATWTGVDRQPPTGERLRIVRAVAALELAAKPDARKLLGELAAGANAATTTNEAKWALERYNSGSKHR